MRLRSLIAFCLLIPFATAFGQLASLRGIVTDSVSRIPIHQASITLSNLGDPRAVLHVTSASDGSFIFESVATGRYLLRITHLAFDTLTTTLWVSSATGSLEPFLLRERPIPQREVIVTGTPPPVEQIGDTMQFYAGAFAVNKDASAEELITKMPGVTVEGTTVKSQGEDIRRVLVDGRQFFSDDPMIALRNLPAEIIERVQVYDKMSDQAELTGFDDGQSVRTMNLITRLDRRNGTFGKAFAGYGTDDRYAAGVSGHRFDNEQRISVFGLSNTTNQQNFTMQDILGVMGNTSRGRGMMGGGRMMAGGGRPGGGRGGGGFVPDGTMLQRLAGAMNDFLVGEQNGINRTHSFGATFRDEWGGSIDINGNYFVNRSNNQSAQDLNREYLTVRDTAQLYSESNNDESDNTNHRFMFRLQYEIDSMNTLVINPRLTAQLNDASGITLGQNARNTGLVLNTSDVRSTSVTTGYNGSIEITYRRKFDIPGRSVSLQANISRSDRTGSSALSAFTQYPGGGSLPMEALQQESESQTDGTTLGSSLVFTEPVSETGLLQWSYRFSRSENRSAKTTTAFDTLTGAYSIFIPSRSNEFDNSNERQSAGVGFHYNASSLNALISTDLQYSRTSADFRTSFPSVVDKIFRNILPMATLNIRSDRTMSLQFQYRTSTNTPSPSQLQTAIDNTNPVQLSTGNPDLKQTYTHSITGRFGMPNPQERTSFFVTLSYSRSNNAIATSVFLASRDTILPGGIELKQGTQLSRPVNVNGQQSARAFLMYGFPVEFLGSNMNLNAGLTLSNSPGLINGVENLSRSTNYSQGINIVSTFSTDIDFTLSYTGNYTSTKNSVLSTYDNTYYSHVAGVRSTIDVWEGLIVRTDLTQRYYSGLKSTFTQRYTMWNASIGKKLFNNDQGEITLSVYDILRQNTNISISTTEMYTETQRTNALGQFILLTFTYTLRSF